MDDFYLFANCNFVPDRYADVRMISPCLSSGLHLFETLQRPFL